VGRSQETKSSVETRMTIHLSITGRSAKDALVVPASAVYKNDDGADYVIVAGTDSHAAWKTVQTGIRNSEFVQIASGLNEASRSSPPEAMLTG